MYLNFYLSTVTRYFNFVTVQHWKPVRTKCKKQYLLKHVSNDEIKETMSLTTHTFWCII